MSDALDLSERLTELRERATADYKQETGAWSQYHHALQAAYERGELVPSALVAEKVREAFRAGHRAALSWSADVLTVDEALGNYLALRDQKEPKG